MILFNPQERAKDLRLKLYRRQRVILRLNFGHEHVCLPGELIRINPKLLR